MFEERGAELRSLVVDGGVDVLGEGEAVAGDEEGGGEGDEFGGLDGGLGGDDVVHSGFKS